MLCILCNPFNVNVVGDGCPVCHPFIINMFAVEIEPTDMQEDMVLKISVSATLPLSFDNR